MEKKKFKTLMFLIGIFSQCQNMYSDAAGMNVDSHLKNSNLTLKF